MVEDFGVLPHGALLDPFRPPRCCGCCGCGQGERRFRNAAVVVIVVPPPRPYPSSVGPLEERRADSARAIFFYFLVIRFHA